jgi:hypothetical protein
MKKATKGGQDYEKNDLRSSLCVPDADTGRGVARDGAAQCKICCAL